MLYQKVRPTKLKDFFGNKEVVSMLNGIIKNKEERPHVFLFKGPSGCGKTTLAKILATEFGCSFMNTMEINAADARGIESIRKLREDVLPFKPMDGGNRIIIFDEAHMLTKESQNCLLKILEDISDHQYFILCSTDPNKIIKTIRNRCCEAEVKPLGTDDIIDLLLSVEDYEVSDNILSAIVSASEGCARRSLVLLETTQGLPEGEALDLIKSYVGEDSPEVIELCRNLVKGSWSKVKDIFKGIKTEQEAETIRRIVLGYLQSCLLSSDYNKGQRFAEAIDLLADDVFESGHAGLISKLWFACGCFS